MEKLDNKIEALFLFAVLAAMVFYVNAGVYDNRLNHEFPYSYFAADGFAYLVLTEYLYDSGSQLYHPSYSSVGFEKALWVHGVFPHSAAVALSYISGMEPYDSLYLIVTLLVVINALLMYVIIRSFNKKVAMISVGFYAFFVIKFFYFTYLWGQIGAITGMFFLTGLIWYASRMELKNSAILLVILFSAGMISHIIEMIYAVAILGLFILLKYFIEDSEPKNQTSQTNQSHKKNTLKKLFKDAMPTAIGILIAVILNIYYLILFYFGAYQSKGLGGGWGVVRTGDVAGIMRVASFPDFGNIAIIGLFAGTALCLYLIFVKKQVKVPLIAGLVLFAFGFGNYFGLGGRPFHLRAFWPIYLSIFIGSICYFIFSQILKRIKIEEESKEKISIFIYPLAGILIFGLIISTYYTPMKGPGVMDPYHWDIFTWIEGNTESNATIFLFYGDGYSQNGRLMKRVTYFINIEDYASTLQTQNLKYNYTAEIMGLGLGDIMYWKDGQAFHFGKYALEQNLWPYVSSFNICNFDYYVFDGSSGYAPALTQLNMYVRQKYLINNMTEVYNNGAISIVKNTNKGGDCIA